MEKIEQTVRESLKYHIISEVNGRIRIRITDETKARLIKASYGIYNHSTVELCHWTKSALVKGQSCYKFKFYGGAPAGGSTGVPSLAQLA